MRPPNPPRVIPAYQAPRNCKISWVISAGIQFCVPQNLRYFALLHKLILRINWIPPFGGMTTARHSSPSPSLRATPPSEGNHPTPPPPPNRFVCAGKNAKKIFHPPHKKIAHPAPKNAHTPGAPRPRARAPTHKKHLTG